MRTNAIKMLLTCPDVNGQTAPGKTDKNDDMYHGLASFDFR